MTAPAKLALSAKAPAHPRWGAPLKLRVTVRNSGGVADSAVRVTATLPRGFGRGTLTAKVGTLAAGANRTVVLTLHPAVHAPATAKVTLRATGGSGPTRTTTMRLHLR